MRNEASSSNSREESVVADCGRHRSSCGYCKSSGRTSISHGPVYGRTVLPLMIIKCMPRFLDGTLEVRKQIELADNPNTSKHTGSSVHHAVSSSAGNESFSCGNKGENKAEECMHHLSDQIDKVVQTYIESGEFPSGIQLPKVAVKKVSHAKRKLSVEGSEDLLYSNNIAFQIAATLRRNLANISGLTIRAGNGHINFYSAAKNVSLDGGVQIVSLPKESGSGSKSSEHPQGKKRKLEICLKRSSFDPEEYALYRQYQIKVHNDTPDRVTESSYRRFLVDTPLLFVSPSVDGMVPPCGFGSFHQQYIIDGKLVAVGVIDILPRCLSSKYLFWDPDIHFYHWVDCISYSEPLVDKKKYIILSDFASLQDEESSQSCIPESVMELQHDDIGLEDSNDVLMDDDEEMIEIESESSDDELDPETSGLGSAAIDDGDLSNVLIGLKGSRLRYKASKCLVLVVFSLLIC
ncbi:hypothetical protein CRYUN_Cryun09bG0108800 [Craigia yunnanensis]